MKNFSSEYIISFLSKSADISIIQRDENEGLIGVYGEQSVADSLLQYLKTNSIQNGTRIQLDGKTFDIWSESKGTVELYILIKVDDKVELEDKVLDYSYLKDSDMVYREILHEIRTPLGTMRNFLHIVTEEMIRHGGGRRKNDLALDNLQAIHEEIMRIDSMLNAFRGAWNGAEIDRLSSDLAYEAGFMEKIYRKVFEVKGVTFSVKGPENGVHISAPSRSVRQVLSNLIQNAFEAVEEGGEVWVRTGDLGGKGVLEVGDNGGGIDARLMPFLFKKPLDSDKGEGRGYGLWITGKMVRKYEGSIEYERTGDGSVIRVEFQKSDRAE
jgi:signal transduction histidine kinase